MRFKILLTIVILALFTNVYSQYECKSTKNDKQEDVKKCFHRNGEISTLEIWDKDKRQGKAIGFNNKGEKLYEFSLRTYAGHSSVYIKYYENGQVKNIEYSSAPDGGIQWYKEKIEYSEIGVQLSKDIQEYPENLIVPKPYDTKKTVQNTVNCAVPFTTYYKIKNSTNKNIEIKLFPQKNQWIKLNEKIISVKKNKHITIDSIILAQIFLNENEGYLPSINLPKKKYNKYSLLKLETIQQSDKKIYQWIIIKN